MSWFRKKRPLAQADASIGRSSKQILRYFALAEAVPAQRSNPWTIRGEGNPQPLRAEFDLIRGASDLEAFERGGSESRRFKVICRLGGAYWAHGANEFAEDLEFRKLGVVGLFTVRRFQDSQAEIVDGFGFEDLLDDEVGCIHLIVNNGEQRNERDAAVGAVFADKIDRVVFQVRTMDDDFLDARALAKAKPNPVRMRLIQAAVPSIDAWRLVWAWDLAIDGLVGRKFG